MVINKFITIIILAGLFSCGTYRQQTQVNESTYLQIIGEPKGETLILDNDVPIVLDDDIEISEINGQTVMKFRITKGKHTIKILRDGKIIVNRVFYISSGNVFELELP